MHAVKKIIMPTLETESYTHIWHANGDTIAKLQKKNEVFQLPSRIRYIEVWAQRVRASSQTVSNLILLKANELANAGIQYLIV